MERRKFTGLLMSLTASGILAPLVGNATIKNLSMMNDESILCKRLFNNHLRVCLEIFMPICNKW